ncbi:hypothetical protein V2J09_002036 [Rumex salicifolius]
MDSCCEEDDNQFFDARDDITVLSESDSDCLQSDVNSSQFDIWVQNPLSVQERRSKFFNWLDLSASKVCYCEGLGDSSAEVDWITISNNGEMVRRLSSGYKLSSSRSSSSSCSSQDLEFHGGSNLEKKFLCRIGSNGDKCIAQELKEDDQLGEFSVNKVAAVEHLENTDVSHYRGSEKNVEKWWLKKLRSFSCVMDKKQWQTEESNPLLRIGLQRVKVRQCGKKQRELSALYSSQDFQAHEGSILAMKFSPDGRYLASAGEDRIVRVWKVVEDERSNDVKYPDLGPLCLYFRMNNELELQPLYADKERMGKVKSWSKSSDSACVILPPKVFRLLEKPLHEFKGHSGEILDLSWSHSNCLLSSSVDKTVRLWRVGCNHCLKVFSHNNYVTSIHFNPMDDNLFISGSIDGKVRIWEILGCQVVSWTDIKDIVTAVSYHPDGQGVLVGSIAGFCRYYKISDSQLELDGQICLRSKKKSSGKRIIGFEYFPHDSSKVLVTSADSQVRILKGMDVIAKYKGNRTCGNYLSASFTYDGKHIVSACEDSNVYMWNCANHDDQVPSRTRKVKSFERFQSTASLAIPWQGFQNVNVGNSKRMTKDISLPSPSIFPLEQEFFLESYYPKGFQTWPEEKLPAQSHLHLISSMHKTEYKFLRACQSTSSPHIWGLVILTAGLDGRIRSFHNYGLPKAKTSKDDVIRKAMEGFLRLRHAGNSSWSSPNVCLLTEITLYIDRCKLGIAV